MDERENVEVRVAFDIANISSEYGSVWSFVLLNARHIIHDWRPPEWDL